MGKDKKTKRCSKSKRFQWWLFGATGLGARLITALALITIAIKLEPVKNEAKLFNICVNEFKATGQNASSAVNFCNGGNLK